MPKVAPLQSNEILFEDNHLLVVNKRAGLVTQGAAEGQPSLFEMAKDYIRRKYNKPGNVYLGIVSRLDAKTTGVIVLARTSKAAARLTKQFKDRETKKIYWAIVAANSYGESIARTGKCENWMFKDDAAMRMRCVADRVVQSGNIPRDAKIAKLSWDTIGQDGDRSLLEIELQTGRKHQIRCQLAAAGFPISGDEKYGSKAKFAGRGIALHSKSVEFTHPTLKKVLQFEAHIPDCWKITRYNL
ncbi:RluA family pseudouridine synthase [Mariniblastus fucicola]|uniref:Ribosomal large subunit pseudouridine synthase A n=1 Tax=Mariniblastus fucicola TaxID=980251 RepID=A0A5B9P433_9BACT|nr:RluA family pseudouridine synthase [Mariniblastus fucicola]QEG21168.1 Ribosomal large subunit pseudouridine synthase A [Mariniblastus fucicola]